MRVVGRRRYSGHAILAAGLISIVMGGCAPGTTATATPLASESTSVPSAIPTDTEPPTSQPSLAPSPLAWFETPGATPGSAWTSIAWSKLPDDSPLPSMRAVVRWRRGYVAYGSKGLWASSDGRSWRPASPDLPAGKAAVVEVSGGLAALVFDATDCPVGPQPCLPTSPVLATAWTSSDGLNWTDRGPATGISGQQVVSVAGNSLGAVATAVGGNKPGVYFSEDGVAWKPTPVPSVSATFPCGRASVGLGMFILLCPAARETTFGDLPTQPVWSLDGINWAAGGAPKTSRRPAGMDQVLSGRNGLMALGFIPGEAGPAQWWRSADGKAWVLLAGYSPVGSFTTKNAIPGGTYPNGNLAADGTRIVALGYVTGSGDLNGRTWTSWDGKSWQQLVSHGTPDGSGFDVIVFPTGVLAGGWWGAAS